MRKQRDFSRLTKRLRNIHIMPVRQIVLHGPIGSAAMNFPCQIEQLSIARAIIKPENAVKIVAAAHALPIVSEKFVVRNGVLIMKIFGHEIEHAWIDRMIVISLEGIEHD